MASIIIENNPAKAFSTFETTLQVLNKAMDMAGDRNTEVVLKGVTPDQSNAVLQVLQAAYLFAVEHTRPDIPASDLKVKSDGKKMIATLGKAGELTVTYDSSKRESHITLPNTDEEALPISAMKQFIRGLHASLTQRMANSGVKTKDPVTGEPSKKEYYLYNFSNREMVELAQIIFSAVAHVQGFTEPDDLHTVLEANLPCILLNMKAVDAIRKNETLSLRGQEI